jgi:hypothetical protein
MTQNFAATEAELGELIGGIILNALGDRYDLMIWQWKDQVQRTQVIRQGHY